MAKPSAVIFLKWRQAPLRMRRNESLRQAKRRRKSSGRITVLYERRRWPRGASAPIRTWAPGSAALTAGYAARTSPRYRCGATGVQRPRLQLDCGDSHV
jgi:hypothetical protein